MRCRWLLGGFCDPAEEHPAKGGVSVAKRGLRALGPLHGARDPGWDYELGSVMAPFGQAGIQARHP
jgi:hypothetical protein